MTLRVERDPAWWTAVATHPVVMPMIGGVFTVDQIAALVSQPKILPLASEHGGFWFVAIDSFMRVRELHSLFTPEGWGREVHRAAKEAFEQVFTEGCDLVVTHQIRDNSRSAPPKSFGFRPLGEFAPSMLGDVKTWQLTHEAWLDSPGRRRGCH